MNGQLNRTLEAISGWVWGLPLIFLLVGTGAYYMVILRAMPVRRLGQALHLAFIQRRDPDADGDISHFQALMTALAATVGVGNIAGVATAIALGGPGALFWMWVTGIVGMASKYAEAVLAVRYRVTNPNGEMSGGPMYYIAAGMNRRWLAALFAGFAALAAFGIGNLVQSHSVAHGLESAFGVPRVASAAVMGVVASIVIVGGIRTIAVAASAIVPVMIVAYVGAGLWILVLNAPRIPEALALIMKSAFQPTAAAGGFAGATLALTLRAGIARGIFSNESGLGSSAIAAAAAQTSSPVRQGLVSMTQTFLDTLVVCTITGLAIVVSGVWNAGSSGAELTIAAFQSTLGTAGAAIVPVSLALFAFSTILGWSYYGEKSIEFLAGVRAVKPYRLLFCGVVFLGAFGKLETIWSGADILNGLMAFPNLVALIALTPVVVDETRRYFNNR